MVSKQILHILGLELHVFGLEEYKKLPKKTPLCAMFFSTGVKTPQEYVEDSCQQICTLNNNRAQNDGYLIMISLDHPNIGSKELYRDDVIQMTKTFNAELLSKMYLHAKSTAFSISLIIECFDLYVFGENSDSFVQKWGISGFSMGGITASLSASISPKVETIILMGSTLNYIKWAEHLATYLGFADDFYQRKNEAKMVQSGIQNYIKALRNTKLLVLYGDKDKCVSLLDEELSLQELREVHNGIEGEDWKCVILPIKQHGVSSVYNAEAMKWIKKWMSSEVQPIYAKI